MNVNGVTPAFSSYYFARGSGTCRSESVSDLVTRAVAEMDKDGDEALSLDESGMGGLFSAFDSDGDDLVTSAEILAFIQSMEAAVQDAPPPSPLSSEDTAFGYIPDGDEGAGPEVSSASGAQFDDADTNQDGVVSPVEELYSAFDSNGDGRITSMEILAFIQAMQAQGQEVPLPPPPSSEETDADSSPDGGDGGSPEVSSASGAQSDAAAVKQAGYGAEGDGASLKVSGASGARFHDAGTNLAGYIPDGAQGEAPKVSGASGARFDYAAANRAGYIPDGDRGEAPKVSGASGARFDHADTNQDGVVSQVELDAVVLNGRAAVAVTGMTSTAGASSPDTPTAYHNQQDHAQPDAPQRTDSQSSPDSLSVGPRVGKSVNLMA